DLRQRLGGDRGLGQLQGDGDVADGLDGAGRAQRLVPAARAELAEELLELGGDLGARLLPALSAELAVREEAAGAGDAAHLQAFALHRLEALADDELGGAAADVHDQAPLARRWLLAVGDAEVDQARLLAAGDDVDAVPQRRLRRQQEDLRIGQLAHGIGGDGANPVRRDAGDALAEARQAVQGPGHHRRIQAALAVEAFGQAYRFLDAVDDAQLPQHVPGHHHVETVGAQVHRRQQLAVFQRWQGMCRHGVQWQYLASRLAWAECGISSPSGRMRT